MARTILFSVALVLVGTLGQAEEAKAVKEKPPAQKSEYHVYASGCRGGVILRCSYSSVDEACRAAAELRSKLSGQTIEVTKGTDGKRIVYSEPSRYAVYARVCEKSGWQLQATFADANRAHELATALKKKLGQAEIVRDYTPREVFSVHGGTCRRSMRLLGSYITAEEACEAAQEFRAKKLQCEVTSGFKDARRRPWEYQVYVRGCKAGWSLVGRTKELNKAQEMVEARTREGKTVELVLRAVGK